MSADRLREAANLLRERAEKASPAAGWKFYNGGKRDDGTDPADSGLIAWISLMSPDIGLALADWIDAEADERRWGRLRDFDAVGISDRIADLILGDKP